MESNSTPDTKVFVVLSRTQTKIWKGRFESGTTPLSFEEDFVSRDYKKVINQYFSGRNRSKLDPKFAERVAHELVGFHRIYLAGGGNGKSSAIHNLASFLMSHHPAEAKNIRCIEDMDASHMSDNELLAAARKFENADLLRVKPGQA